MECPEIPMVAKTIEHSDLENRLNLYLVKLLTILQPLLFEIL
jgi:hypothetical protein